MPDFVYITNLTFRQYSAAAVNFFGAAVPGRRSGGQRGRHAETGAELVEDVCFLLVGIALGHEIFWCA